MNTANRNPVEDSYIHHLVRCPECHIDALQSTGGSSIVVRNTRSFPNARYGGVAHLGPGISFDDSNVWDDTGEPVSGNNNRRQVGW